MKHLLHTKNDWKSLKTKFVGERNRGYVKLSEGHSAPRSYPCVAVGFTRVFMTEADEVSFGFVYQKDFK